jgi:tRNA(Ile)-lysidine synthase
LPRDRQRNVLRAWLKRCSGRVPSTAVLTRIVNDVLCSRPDAGPCVRWDRHEVRRYRDELFCLQQAVTRDVTQALHWTLSAPLALPGAGGVLTVTRVSGAGLRYTDASATGVYVSWRKGGECCVPAGRKHHLPLKKLFQEQGIPPWERQRIPLIYIGGELAMVPGLCVCEPFQAGPAEPGLLITWDSGSGSPD